VSTFRYLNFLEKGVFEYRRTCGENKVNELYTEVKENCFQSAPSPSLQTQVQFRFHFFLTFSATSADTERQKAED